MKLPPPPPGAAHISWQFAYTGANFGTGIWAIFSGTVLPADLTTVATDFYGIYETRLLPWAGNQVHLTECIVRYWSTDGYEYLGSSSADHLGGRPGTELAAASCTVLQLRSGIIYRGGKSRMYLPPGTTSDLLDSRHWGPTYTAGTANAGQGLINDMSAVTAGGITAVEPCYLERVRAGVPITPHGIPHPIQSVGCQQRVCNQRRRLGPLVVG